MRRSLTLLLTIVLLSTSGCKIRTISDGKPPHNGVFKREIENSPFGKLTSEEHYVDGQLRYVKTKYDNGNTAYERFITDGIRQYDSNVSYYRNGQLQTAFSFDGDKVLQLKEYYENGSLKGLSDTTMSEEFYENGHKKTQTLFRGGQVIKISKWFSTGKPKEAADWWKDKRNGQWKEWDSTGKQTRNERYKDNIKQ